MPLRDDLLKPISGGNPAGANLRYDPITDKIKEARREDLDVPQGQWKTTIKTADYKEVIKLCSDALAKKGKDLQIAVWLVDAHMRREGFATLAPSFIFLRELLERFWDGLYPEIEDGDLELRAAPLEWLGTRLEEPMRLVPFTTNKLGFAAYQESRMVGYEADANTGEKEDTRNQRISEGKLTAELFDEAVDETPIPSLQETVKQLSDAMTALQDLSDYCDLQFGDVAPSFLKTRDAIEQISDALKNQLRRRGVTESTDEEPEPEPEPEPEETYEEPVAEASSGLGDDWSTVEPDEPSESAAASFSGSLSEDPEDFGARLAALCREYRTLRPHDTIPYLVMRAFRWGQLFNDYPNIDKDMIEEPPGDLRRQLRKLATAGDWESVINLTEEAMEHPYSRNWLDIQRYTVQGLSILGRGNASVSVRVLFRWVLEEFPDLKVLTLPDDTPAANEETKEWIRTFVIPEKVPVTPAENSEDISVDSSGFDALADFGSTESDTPSFDSSESGLSDFSTDFSAETSSSDDSSSLDAFSAEPEPEPAAEPTFTPLDEEPPIIELDETPPSLPDLEPVFAEAIAAVKEGRTAEGLAKITEILATERSGRGRFRRRTQLAHLLLVGGQTKIARPLLDQLAAELEARKLEEWEENEAVAYPLELLMRCLASGDEQQRTDLFVRLCQLDPVRALNVTF